MDRAIVTLGHGGGGQLTTELVREVFLPFLENPLLAQLQDAAVFGIEEKRIALTTDSFVVSPRIFPGGDLGRLAICGTVNDLAVAGATPRYLTAGFLLEEGFFLKELRQHLHSMREAAQEAGVAIVAGDTKVVPRGAVDGLFINTSGVGEVPPEIDLSPRQIQPGDRLLVSGTLGDHGLAVMVRREGLQLETEIRSDVAPLVSLTSRLRQAQIAVRCMRDPTRGGLAQSLYEFSEQARRRFVLWEEQIPVRPVVQSACDLLGLDPLQVANEGKLVAVVPAEQAQDALHALRQDPLGQDAAIIGEVEESEQAGVLLQTRIGGRRFLSPPTGELLPRIC